jgi:mRNA interferase RelE/StbE
MAYEVVLSPRAQRDLDGLPDPVRQRVVSALHKLANHPFPPGCKKLGGRDEWRVCVGDHRIIYDVHGHEVWILLIKHRREAY